MGDGQPQNRNKSNQEMSAFTTKISILFRPLLATIIDCLQLPPPEFAILDQSLHTVSITMRSLSGSVDGLYLGGPSATNEEAFEQASHFTINNLKEMYDIYVKDITALKKQLSERCTNLWRLKRQQLEQLAKGLPKNDTPEEFDSPEISHLHMVTIDFLQLLSSIQRKAPVQCSDIEVVEHTPASFTAWMSITHHNSTSGCTYMCGDTSLSYQSAQQDLAAKVITYLAPIYNIEVIDVNHCESKFDIDALVCKMVEKKCKMLRRGRPLPDKNAPTKSYTASITTPVTPNKLVMRGHQSQKARGSETKTGYTLKTPQAMGSAMPDSA